MWSELTCDIRAATCVHTQKSYDEHTPRPANQDTPTKDTHVHGSSHVYGTSYVYGTSCTYGTSCHTCAILHTCTVLHSAASSRIAAARCSATSKTRLPTHHYASSTMHGLMVELAMACLALLISAPNTPEGPFLPSFVQLLAFQANLFQAGPLRRTDVRVHTVGH